MVFLLLLSRFTEKTTTKEQESGSLIPPGKGETVFTAYSRRILADGEFRETFPRLGNIIIKRRDRKGYNFVTLSRVFVAQEFIY